MDSPIPETVVNGSGQPESSDLPNLEIPPFASRCLDKSNSIWEASIQHPFVRALIDGTLTEDRFRFYQMQDARYLEAFADTCSLISTRCSDPDIKLWFIDAARLAIVVERELHAGYGVKFGYTPEDVSRMELTPNNMAYQNHMVSSAVKGSMLNALAAIAPCAWLYTDIGIRIVQQEGEIDASHPFADWLATYADPAFISYTNELLRLLERAARNSTEQEKERAIDAFKSSVRYEWMFWEQAWTFQEWPV